MADETKEPKQSAEQKREQLIREKMLVGGMTRESAIMVIEHQEAEDAKRAKKK